MDKLLIDIDKIKTLYLEEQKSCQQISKIIGISVYNIIKALRKEGIEVINKQNISKIDKELGDRIIDLYTSTEIAVTEVSKIINKDRKNKISTAIIYKFLKKQNIKIINYQNRAKFNENVFDNISDEKSSYWFGFILADGYISSSRNEFEISLKKSDYKHLIKFNEFMEHEKLNITFSSVQQNNKTFNRCRWEVTNKHLHNKLDSLGCTPNKSTTLLFPDFMKNITNDEILIGFLRGYFDGDGCLSYMEDKSTKKYIPAISIISTEMFLNVYKSILFDKFNIDSGLTKDKRAKNKETSVLYIKKKDSIKFLDLLYSNSNIYLDRKYNRYKFLKDSPSAEELAEFLADEYGKSCDANAVVI